MKGVSCLLIFSLSFTMSFSQEKIQDKPKELSHYLFPEFTKGAILLKTGIMYEALLNYNSLTEEMIFENKGKKLAIGKEELEKVDTVFIEGKKFFTLNHKFIELIYHSKYDLYAENKCKVNEPGKPSAYGGTSQTAAITVYSSFATDSRVYELKLPEGYEVKAYIIYWLKKDGELNKFMTIKQLMKLFNDKKDLFKAYIKKHDVKYTNQESIIQLIKYLETNFRK